MLKLLIFISNVAILAGVAFLCLNANPGSNPFSKSGSDGNNVVSDNTNDKIQPLSNNNTAEVGIADNNIAPTDTSNIAPTNTSNITPTNTSNVTPTNTNNSTLPGSNLISNHANINANTSIHNASALLSGHK